jgi:hypothetical protein
MEFLLHMTFTNLLPYNQSKRLREPAWQYDSICMSNVLRMLIAGSRYADLPRTNFLAVLVILHKLDFNFCFINL